MRSLNKWTAIFLMPPSGGWNTENLTEDKLMVAFNKSPHNKALFLDKHGNPLHQVGYITVHSSYTLRVCVCV